MRVPDDYQFDARSPVGRYWLIHGVGFTVCRRDGRRLGVVEDVVVDPVEQRAESVMLRRRGLLPSRRHETIDPGVVEAVVPASRLFVVEPAEHEPVPPSPEAGGGRSAELATWVAWAIAALGRSLRAVWRAIQRAVAVSAPVVSAGLRLVGAGLVVAGRLGRRGAAAGGRATAAAGGRARADAPRLAAWSSARSRATGRATATGLRALGRHTRAAARAAAAFLRRLGHALGELAVLAAMAVVAAARWVGATVRPERTAPAEEPPAEEPLSEADADAPLGRDEAVEEATPAEPRRRRPR